MNDDKLIGEIEKNDYEVVKILLGFYKGKNYVHIRTWAKAESPDGKEVYVATKKGIVLNVELLPELKKLIDQALEEAKAIDPGLAEDTSDEL